MFPSQQLISFVSQAQNNFKAHTAPHVVPETVKNACDWLLTNSVVLMKHIPVTERRLNDSEARRIKSPELCIRK